jgi:hypothetical protein
MPITKIDKVMNAEITRDNQLILLLGTNEFLNTSIRPVNGLSINKN